MTKLKHKADPKAEQKNDDAQTDEGSKQYSTIPGDSKLWKVGAKKSTLVANYHLKIDSQDVTVNEDGI